MKSTDHKFYFSKNSLYHYSHLTYHHHIMSKSCKLFYSKLHQRNVHKQALKAGRRISIQREREKNNECQTTGLKYIWKYTLYYTISDMLYKYILKYVVCLVPFCMGHHVSSLVELARDFSI